MPERPPEPPLTADEAAKHRAVSYLGRIISKRYRIDEVIAMGGMGAVYRGEHVHMHKRVAIKILHPDTERLPELVQRFEREAVAGAHIQHRNVATATDFGEAEDGSFFLVLEYVRGTTLHEIIRRGPMPAARAALIARQLAAGLGTAHAMGIVHRDVKPRNVMVVEPQGDFVKLIDFGLAKVSVDELRRSGASPESVRMEGEPLPVRLTTAGVIFGTIAYLAPESALGMDFVDERADLYALGLIFYEMLAGKHPFLAKDPVALFNQQRSAPVPAIAEHAPGVAVPPAIEAVVRRLLEKQPRARFEGAAELIAALDEACAASGIVMVEPRAEMGSRAEMTSVPAIADAARVPSNRPPLPSALSREPEAGSGGASAIVLGDSCLVSLTDVADALEPAAQQAAGEPAGSGASAPEPAGASDRKPLEAAEDEEDAASQSRPTPVRDTPTLFAELTRDSRPTTVGGAAFMAQVAFSREEAAGRAASEAAAEAEEARLSSDSRPTAVGGAAFMAQVAFSREEAAREAAGPPSPRAQEQAASKEPALQEPALQEPALQEPALQEPALQEPAPPVSTPLPLEAPSLAPAEPAGSLEEPASKEPAGPTSARPPMEEPAPEPSERGPSEPSPKQPSLPGTEEPSASAAERASSKPPSAPAAERASSKPASSKPPSAPAAERASSKSPSAPAAERASSKPSSAPAAERASSKPPSAPPAEPVPSTPPSSSAAQPAPSKPPAPSVEEPASAKTPAPSVKAQPPEKELAPAAPASLPPEDPPAEEDAPVSEPTSERMSGSRPAFAPTLLRELEAAEAERIAREREEEARRKLAEETERAAKEREEKARRKRAAREARASRPSREGLGGRLGRIAPYLGGVLLAAGVIAALASGGRAPPEPEPQLGQTSPPASALATSEPAPAAAAPEAAAPATTAVPDAPAEPPPDDAARKALTDASRARRWVKAAEALNLLAERDPTALRERAIAIAARNVAIAISKTGGELADKVFDALASRFGTAGLDVLYEIVETRGRSTPATRAAKLLRDPEIAARGTPAVRISFELRDATCGEKLPFLDRAVSEGDQRTLVVLETAVRPCYKTNRAIDEAIKKLRSRLEDG
ncbi:protein kinase domain-containing protein [Sorangium sp. So ce887]|uniref:serine/threonine-protein kinase n=1 Tax=Sorangium sp. So ce887 TaxID=3133324 RepID=UPI003F62EDD7